MKIAMICTPVVYEKVKPMLEALDLDDLELSEPLPDFDQAMNYLRQGVTGIIIQEGNSASDIIKTIGIPHLIYQGQKDFGDELQRWLKSLRITFHPSKENGESKKPATVTEKQPVQSNESENIKQEEKEELPAPSRLVMVERDSVDSQHETPPKRKGKETVIEAVGTALEYGQRSVGKLLQSVQKRRGKSEVSHTVPGQMFQQPELHISSCPQEVIVLYSPEPTGKTFVGVNLAIALARAGKQVQLMDDSERVKYWFNAPSFPFQLTDLNLRVSGLERTSQAEVLIIETRRSEVLSLFPTEKVFLVVDSDLSHQIEIAKAIHSIQPIGMIWNLESQYGNPANHIHLPVVVSLPRYADTYERIERGVPRALTDAALSQELLKVWYFDPTDHFMKSGVGN